MITDLAENIELRKEVFLLRELLRKVRGVLPQPGFPKCDARCSSIRPAYDEEGRCDCGWEEIRLKGAEAVADIDTALKRKT